MTSPTYLSELSQVPHLHTFPEMRRRHLQAVVDRFRFRSNTYYQSLIDWSDPQDPIRRIVIPHEAELREGGELDPSNEAAYTVAPGLEHKYADTALLLVNDVCGALCRFCFRKRLFIDKSRTREVFRDLTAALNYLRRHREVNNVLITGGDPLLLPTPRLRQIISALRQIEHLQVIRIGSKMPAFNPYRILEDPTLSEIFSTFSTPERRLYFMAHFNHPRELTRQAKRALLMLQHAGAIVMNQTPLIRGLNDQPVILRNLFNTLAALGIAPYYVFQCRPTEGNTDYALPIETGYGIFLEAQQGCSGLGRRARFVMSHATGKIEAAGMTDEHIVFRYLRAADAADDGRTFILPRNPDAHWLDEYYREPMAALA